jgi:hypothetical protein
MGEKCIWTIDMNYHSECGHTYFPYITYDDKPNIENNICPWCGKPIEYDESEYNDDYDEE